MNLYSISEIREAEAVAHEVIGVYTDDDVETILTTLREYRRGLSAVLSDPAARRAACGAAPEAGSKEGVTLALLPFMRLVEDSWYYETKGDLDLTEDPDPALASIVIDLRRLALENINCSASGQFDSHGRELGPEEEVTPEMIAGRIAFALHVIFFGPPGRS